MSRWDAGGVGGLVFSSAVPADAWERIGLLRRYGIVLRDRTRREGRVLESLGIWAFGMWISRARITVRLAGLGSRHHG